MTRPIVRAVRIDRQWVVCFAGRCGVGVTFEAAIRAAGAELAS